MSGALTAVALGLALLGAGIGFDSPSLLVPGVGFIGLATAAIVWVELARPAGLDRGRTPPRVVEGEPYALSVRAFGARVPPPGGALFDPVLDQPLAVGPRWRGHYEAEVRLRGRGRRELGPTRLEVRDPLGLWARSVESAAPGELLVLPRVEPVVAAGGGAGRGRSVSIAGIDDGGTSPLDTRAFEPEVDGLRAYRQGSPASRIHWPAVARTGELVERRLVAGGDSAPLVILDALDPSGADALDAAVRATASLCVRLATAAGCAVVLPGDRRATALEPDLRGWSQVHARLALVEAGAPAAVGQRGMRSGAIFWVTAAARPGLPQSLRATGAAPRFVVAPAAAPGRGRVAFTVAGCEGRAVASRSRRGAERRAA